ncbi:MAG: cardiolipin synthase [Paenibacillus sp.]|nr:cardiolipin synthase [Paenibacillus sp.]
MGWIIIVLVLFSLQLFTILVAEFRNPPKSVAWLMVMFILPIVGFVLYFYIAREYRQHNRIGTKHRTKRSESEAAFTEIPTGLEQCEVFHEPRLLGLLKHIQETPIRPGNEVILFHDTASIYAALFAAIDQAMHYIHLEFYTIRDDNIGVILKQALIRKAHEGVSVKVIVDGVGSYQLSPGYVQELRHAGVELYIFLPLRIAFINKRLNYRNHRKIVVVDGRIGFVGGINIGDEYLGGNPNLGYWRDTHLQVYGSCVKDLNDIFAVDWMFVSGMRLDAQQLRMYSRERIDKNDGHDVKRLAGPREHMQIISSGPDAPWDSIQELFFSGMAVAKQRIYITTPYFIPDPSIAMVLKTAALSGLDVRIILPGVPDSKLVHWATLSYIQEFLQAGVRCYQYRKGFVHSKTLIIDHMLGSVGTANMDMRSFFSNFEVTAVLYDQASIERLEQDFHQDMLDSVEIDPQAFASRSRFERGREVIARILSPLF